MRKGVARFNLFHHHFSEDEKEIVSIGRIKVSGFRYRSGISALRVLNSRGEVIILPFHGQQVWDAKFDERCIKMQTAVREPKDTQDFLLNMGGFLFHCGMSAMGSPGPEDDHPIHGELVNAKYQRAWLEAGENEKGAFIVVGGEYIHAEAFGNHYSAKPTIRLYEDDSLIQFGMRVRNLNKTPMEYMYLAHINFLPIEQGELVYSAKYDADHVKIRSSFPSHMKPTEKLSNFVNDLVKDPKIHHIIKPEFTFDPEIVFTIDYEADTDGWAHALYIHPDGSADYVRHKPAQLDHGVRWICRTPNQEALGLEVGTAGVGGYSAEKAKGNVKSLEPGGEFFCEYTAGLVDKEIAKKLEQEINSQMGRI